MIHGERLTAVHSFALVPAVLLVALAIPAAAEAEEGPLSLSGSTSASFAAWEDRGSVLLPAGAAAAYAGSAKAELRAEAGGTSSCAFEGTLALDAVTGAVSFEARELWAEWRPISAIAFRAGRQRLGFGSGYGWNPSNDLDPRRDASDPSAPRKGTDAAQLRLDATDFVGFPLSLSVEGVLPVFAADVDLSESCVAAQLYAFAGEVELMAVASASRFGRSNEAWLAGAWATLPLGPFVIGLEGAARRRADFFRPGQSGSPVADRGTLFAAVATATLRAGDFVFVGEAAWDQAAWTRDELDAILASNSRLSWATVLLSAGSVGKLHALGRITWGSGDLTLGAGALVDAETGAWIASADASLASQGSCTIRLKTSIPGSESLLRRDELGLSGRGWMAQASVSVHF